MVFHLVTYFGSQYLEGEPHTVGGSLDERIPFHPGWIYIYSSWFVLLLGVPALLNIVAPELCLKYMLAHSIDQLLSNIIYLIYPTTFERPVPPKKGLTGFVIGTVYGANHRFLNCAPSVHCSVSFLFAFAALAAPMLPLWLRLVIVVWSLAIVASTMLVKQHMVIDAVTALPAAAVCWLLAGLVFELGTVYAPAAQPGRARPRAIRAQSAGHPHHGVLPEADAHPAGVRRLEAVHSLPGDGGAVRHGAEPPDASVSHARDGADRHRRAAPRPEIKEKRKISAAFHRNAADDFI